MELSQEEKDAVLRFGSDSDLEILPIEIRAQLMKKNILHHRPSDGRLDFTAFGETICDQLTRDEGSEAGDKGIGRR